MGAWRPKHVEWVCRNKTCTVLHHVGVLFNLAIPKHTGLEAKGSDLTTGRALFWACSPFRGNFNHWKVSRKEAGQIFFKFPHYLDISQEASYRLFRTKCFTIVLPWDVTPCCLVYSHRYFGGPKCLGLEGQTVQNNSSPEDIGILPWMWSNSAIREFQIQFWRKRNFRTNAFVG